MGALYEYKESTDIWLFENDLSEYQNSDEGKKVQGLIEYNDYDLLARKDHVSPQDLKTAFMEYWNARNDRGLHYSNTENQMKGRAADHLEAELHRGQN